MLSRFATPVVFCLFLGASPAAQVNYFTLASEADLLDGGVLADVEIDCMALWEENGTDLFVFYNESTDDLVGHDASETPGNRTTILRTNAEIDADFGGDVTDCRAITVYEENIYAALSVDNVDYIYKVDLAGSSSVLGEADGTTGVDARYSGSLLYLARVEFFGAPADGFYTMSTTGEGQTPVEVATHPDLDLYDLVITTFEEIYSSSSKFGSGAFQNVFVRLNLPEGTITVVDDPFSDGIFSNGGDGGLEDLSFDNSCLCAGGFFAFNNSFDAPGGEQFGYFHHHDIPPTRWRFGDESIMLADPDISISGYSAPDGTHMITSDLGPYRLYVASTSAFGGEDAIIGMTGIPLPVELLSFYAVVDGATIRLTWATASETNNAGFEVQQLNGNSWDVQAFVEGHGTTTVAQTYSFTTAVMDVGRHAFRLRQIDYDGSFAYSDELEVTVETPGTHLLSNAYPNPFNPQSQFSIAVARAERVSADLYNLIGQHIASLFDGTVEANASKIIVIDGSAMASGAYIVRVVGETFSDALRVTLTN